MAWEYETFGPDGQCKLFGVNIFDYDWQTTGKRVKIKDPIYHQDHTFEVWRVEIDGQDVYKRQVPTLFPSDFSGKCSIRPGGLPQIPFWASRFALGR